MNEPDKYTIEEDRPITEREAAVVVWLLENGWKHGPLNHPVEGVAKLRVVGRCACGCASVDFEEHGQSSGAGPIAEGYGKTPEGLQFGLILWGRDGAITGLEIYECHPGSANKLPDPAWLTPDPPAMD